MLFPLVLQSTALVGVLLRAGVRPELLPLCSEDLLKLGASSDLGIAPHGVWLRVCRAALWTPLCMCSQWLVAGL